MPPKPTLPPATTTPPAATHLRPPLPPENGPPPASFPATHPATLVPAISINPTIPPPTIEEALVEDEALVGEIPNYGHGIVGLTSSFGKVTQQEIIDARVHNEAINQALFKAKLDWKRRVGEEDGDCSLNSCEHEEEEVEELDGMEEDNLLARPENKAYRKLLNEFLASKRVEEGEIAEVDAILGEAERERARKGKISCLFENFPVAGATPVTNSALGPAMARNIRPFGEEGGLEGKCFSKNHHELSLHHNASQTITSLSPQTSFPPIFQNSPSHNKPTNFPSSFSNPPLVRVSSNYLNHKANTSSTTTPSSPHIESGQPKGQSQS